MATSDLGEVRAWAASLSAARLRCRLYGHDPVPSSVHVEVLEGSRRQIYVQTERCSHRCGVTWITGISMTTGERFFRRTQYPPGYLAPQIGRIDGAKKNVVRLEDINRRMVQGEQAS